MQPIRLKIGYIRIEGDITINWIPVKPASDKQDNRTHMKNEVDNSCNQMNLRYQISLTMGSNLIGTSGYET